LGKRVVGLLKKEDASKKKEVSRSKKETTKDMVVRQFKGGKGCSKDVWTWKSKWCSKVLLRASKYFFIVQMCSTL
jgi:hypothetical protein